MIGPIAAKLRNGTRIEIDALGAEERLSTPDLDRIVELVVQPQQPWFSEEERVLFLRSIRSRELLAVSNNYLLVARLEGKPVGSVWYQVPGDSPEIGAYGFVFVDPARRGLEIAQTLTMAAVSHLIERGGVAM